MRICLLLICVCFMVPAGRAQVVLTLASVRASGDVTVAPNGDVYIADFGSPSLSNGTTVVRITPDGTTSIFASGLPFAPAGVDFDSQGNLIVASFAGGVLNSIAPDGTVTRLAGANGPVGVVVDENDGIFVAGCNTNAILQLQSTGFLTIFANSALFACPNGITLGHDGAFYVVNFASANVLRVGRDGTVSTFATTPGTGNSHIEFANDTYYLTGRTTHTIYAIAIDGSVSVVAGTGVDGTMDGPATTATISRPNGLGVSPDGRFLYVAGTSNFAAPTLAIRRIDLFPEGQPFLINGGIAGAWLNPDTPGQGFFFDTVADDSDPQLFAAWFTFNNRPPPADETAGFGSSQQRWFTAQGSIRGDTAQLTVSRTSGGIFDDPSMTMTGSIGSMTITFVSCTEARVSYQFSGGAMNEFDIVRLTPDQFCQSGQAER